MTLTPESERVPFSCFRIVIEALRICHPYRLSGGRPNMMDIAALIGSK
jgi:hypothetical protein